MSDLSLTGNTVSEEETSLMLFAYSNCSNASDSARLGDHVRYRCKDRRSITELHYNSHIESPV